MPTVAEVMDKAARRCQVTPPNNWVSSTTATSMELKDYLDDTIDEMLDRVDWPDPITKDTPITGTGVESYALPSDFKRLTRDPIAVYETTFSRRGCTPVHSNGVWTHLQQFGSAGGGRFYRTSGNEEDGYEISFFQDLETGASVTVSYVSTKWVSLAGTEAATWTDVGETLLLPKKLVEMGVIWRFRKGKGKPYADRLNEYEANLARLANDARGIRTIDMTGEARMRSPWDIPVPDFIPPA